MGGAHPSHNPSKMPQSHCHRQHLPGLINTIEEETETVVLTATLVREKNGFLPNTYLHIPMDA